MNSFNLQTQLAQLNQMLGYGNTALDQYSQAMREQNKLAWNPNTIQLGLDGLKTVGSLWSTFAGLNAAKEQYKFQKSITEKNMQNSVKSYNTNLSDTINARATRNGNDKAYVDNYLKLNSLSV